MDFSDVVKNKCFTVFKDKYPTKRRTMSNYLLREPRSTEQQNLTLPEKCGLPLTLHHKSPILWIMKFTILKSIEECSHEKYFIMKIHGT
jgi:hypothetical protein